MANSDTPLTFEQALERLERVVATLEGGNEELDHTLAAYEEGIRLIRLCKEKITVAEQKIEILKKGANEGEIQVESITLDQFRSDDAATAPQGAQANPSPQANPTP